MKSLPLKPKTRLFLVPLVRNCSNLWLSAFNSSLGGLGPPNRAKQNANLERAEVLLCSTGDRKSHMKTCHVWLMKMACSERLSFGKIRGNVSLKAMESKWDCLQCKKGESCIFKASKTSNWQKLSCNFISYSLFLTFFSHDLRQLQQMLSS